MKKRWPGIIVGLVLIATTFMAGRWFERAKSGYHYEILEDKQIASPLGPIHLRIVTESVGFPFLNPGTTLIEIDERLIYKARRIFQENHPVADNLKVHDGLIEWDDGQYSYSLKMQKMQPTVSTTSPN
jgi:hypothetical protein